MGFVKARRREASTPLSLTSSLRQPAKHSFPFHLLLPLLLAKMGSDPQYIKYPDLSIAQDIFNISNQSCPAGVQQASLKKLTDVISTNKMAPLYRHLAHPVDGILNAPGETSVGAVSAAPSATTGSKPAITSNLLASRKSVPRVDLPWDEELYQSLVKDNLKELEAFEKEETEAEEAAGDTEVFAARGKRAEFWARVGDKVCVYTKIYKTHIFADGWGVGQNGRSP